MTTDLSTKYRPRILEEVIGHKEAVRSLRSVLEKGSAHSFIFTGPSGVGKTTFGRIIANHVKCEERNIIEIDAASNSGVDAMREIAENLKFSVMGASKKRVVIIDEAHALSKAAWQAMLKPIEEPPKDTYWVLCTTEGTKIPETIRTRCAVYDLKPLRPDDLLDLLILVANHEGAAIPAPDEVLQLIANRAEGSPRRALTNLALCAQCKSREEAGSLLKSFLDDDGNIADFCRALSKGLTWASAMKALALVKDENPEAIRAVVTSWYTKVALDAKEDGWAIQCLNILDAFGTPYPQGATIAQVVLSLGKVVFVQK